MAKGNMSIYGKFNVKFQPFPGAKTEDMFHCLVSLLEKLPDYVILLVGTNHAIDYKASEIIKKMLQIREFIKLKIPNYKVIISRPIKT